MTTQLTEADIAAMTRAIATVRAQSKARAKQIDAKLRNEPWEDVGRFAAYSAQTVSLSLMPWESTAVFADSPEAHALLRRLFDAGLSKYEPDPLRAIARVEAEQRQTVK